MTTLTDIQTQPASGLLHIDALLGTGPLWNFLTPGRNTISYTFSTTAGVEPLSSREASINGGISAFSGAQQAGARVALNYISQVTGIVFVETAIGQNADFHFACADLRNADTTGLCSWTTPYSYNPATGEVNSYLPDAYIYLDNAEFAAQSANLVTGTYGYQTLLHELGHALGLKHPHQGAIQLPDSEDSTQYTLMSYENGGATHGVFQAYDIAALNFLYGGDGLRGALGYASDSGALYLSGSARAETLTGTSANDVFQGSAGGDVINGGAGTDTLKYNGLRADFTAVKTAAGYNMTSKAGTVDSLTNVERVQFGDVALALDEIGAQAYRMFAAALDRAPKPAGLGFWINALDNGVTLEKIAADFMAVPEFSQLYGTNVTNADFVNLLFDNVLHRPPKEAGFNFWFNALQNEGVSRAHVLMQFSESPENKAQVIAAIQNGVEYTLWHG